MIESIEIKNFRCFKDTKIAKFGLVNLFGGLNNSGKTALLEALFLIKNPSGFSIYMLQKIVRKESSAFGKEKPQLKWNNFFYQQNNKVPIEIRIENFKLTLECDESIDNLINLIDKLDKIEADSVSSLREIVSNKIQNSRLKLCTVKNDTIEYSIYWDGNIETSSTLINLVQEADLISATERASNEWLAKKYDTAKFNGKESIVLKALQLIDDSIESVDVYSIGEPIVYLKRKNEERMPLTLFGDAMNKIADIILRIINNSNSVLLIDEIENGIHYTVQEKLWEMLFKLAKEYNVQIFSTSHSLEMIKAFAKVAQQFPENAAYFEMARSPKTGLIKGIRHDVNTLSFELDRNMTIRGE